MIPYSQFKSISIISLLLQLLYIATYSNINVLACGYQTCPTIITNHVGNNNNNNKILHIHIVPHSHDDVGWLKTADDYYREEVYHVLTNTVSALAINKDRRFVQVEMYYFRRWWTQQDPETRRLVHELVQRGQLSFANGGWCVNDEAVTRYSQIIDQMTLGISFIRNTFGECAVPKVSWQVDPFGASREMANLYSMMNFDGHIVNRGHTTIHHETQGDHEDDSRINSWSSGQIHGEFFWNTSSFLSNLHRNILTVGLHNHYSAPDGFDFEEQNDITEANKHQKAKVLVELARKWNHDYGDKGHVLIPFGDDFKYKNAHHYFTNLDNLIKVVNTDYPDVRLFYSSPQCYIKAINNLISNGLVKLETKSHDYFPLWTGFYSVRPVVKYLDRLSNNLLQTAKQLEVFMDEVVTGTEEVNIIKKTRPLIYEAENELGVLQV